MSILALDIATKCGWAVSCPEIHSGNEKWTPKKLKNNPEHVGNRFYKFKEMLTDLKNRFGITEVYYERSYFGAKGRLAEEIRNQFVGVLLAWACHHDLPVTAVDTSTLRSSYGNKFKRPASKDYAIKCASNYLGREITSDDEADSIMLLKYAIKQKEFLSVAGCFA